MAVRPCAAKHPNPADYPDCPACWRAVHDGRWQRAWGLPVTAPDLSPAARAPSVPRGVVTGRPSVLEVVKNPCIYLGSRVPGKPCGTDLHRCTYDGVLCSKIAPCTETARTCRDCRHYVGSKPVRWVYGVTTVPERRDDLLPRTLASLAAAGFDRPRLFVDGMGNPEGYAHFGNETTMRHPRVGTFGNWFLSLAELFVREPLADRYAVFQDDVVAVRNLRTYIDRTPFPRHGYLNLFTFLNGEAEIEGRPRGWVEGPLLGGQPAGGMQCGRGALGLVFDREGVLSLLTADPFARKPSTSHRPERNVDGAIVGAMNGRGYREWIHSPSLLWHTGTVSAAVPGKEWDRNAGTFPGESFDAAEWVRRG